ncbi:adenylate/guanylate cyclase domain-containing protein [Phyllobacterium salinisoli]|uniref:Adenylate/guanylate cyclase domain-containing protein n=1 Tax=Phyllobacterium salinisoli TaxID=1899321 RepID=A0A368K0D3_9HYPH|nr:adenylate/guanylate cyclase domain-containing protein [Phyllobacterium salinisoli]RCS22624.1 adenylate/guanylate cyclase domain-containing protein [Phyllobacterium salinisoli]
MSTAQSEISTILLDKVADWLTETSLAGDDLKTIVRGFCERLAAAGLPLARVHLSFSMLHPLYDALGFTWRRGQGMEVEGFRKSNGGPSDRFTRSPYYHLFSNNLDHLRRRLHPDVPSEFPIFDELKLIGVTDYLAFVHSFGGNTNQGMVGSWSTDSPGGFSDNMIAALLRMQNHLAVASKMAVLHKLTDNMLTTYLGGDAGKRVLNGQIKRGEGDTVRAALVMADMRHSTRLAETAGRDVYIETLNQYFDAIAAPFNRAGGQILSFLGDGFLAVYPCERHRAPSELACQAALAATHKAIKRMAELNARRNQEGLDEIGYGIGLHVGNVMYGNVGLSDRLTFSVFGSAVNEVQRLQVLTKNSPSRILASKDFANYCANGSWVTVGEEKLPGVKQKFTVLFPDLSETPPADDDGGLEAIYDRISDAEQVILLHRDASKLPLRDPALKGFQ